MRNVTVRMMDERVHLNSTRTERKEVGVSGGERRRNRKDIYRQKK